MDSTRFTFNNKQSELLTEQLQMYPKEVQEEFIDVISNVPFIEYLVSPDRPRAKDLPRDDKGRIIVDLVHPHILEDMDYFRPAALHYKKYGCYTTLRPNANPNSEFAKWMRTEIDRIWNGMVRPSDGEWIPGDLYFYWNYSPILQTKIEKGKKKGNRVIDFPEVWDSTYLWGHYIYQAIYGGKYNDYKGGEHFGVIARRGCGKAHPYHEYIYTPNGIRLWGDLQVGDLVFGDDGKPTKIVSIPFNGPVDTYQVTLRDGRKILCSDEHLWNVEIHNQKGIKTLSTKQLLSIYKRIRKKSERNPTGIEYVCSIPKNECVDFRLQAVEIDPYTFGLLLGDGTFRNQPFYLTMLNEDFDEIRQYIPYECFLQSTKEINHRIKIPHLKDILISYDLFGKKSEDKFIPDQYKFNSKEVRQAILDGLIDSDGYVLKDRVGYYISISSKELSEDILMLCRSLGFNADVTVKNTKYFNKQKQQYVHCLPCYTVTIHTDNKLGKLKRKTSKQYKSIYSKSRSLKTRIVNIEYVGQKWSKCITVDNDSNCYLINDFVVTHNSLFIAAMMAKQFICGENQEVNRSVKNVVVAADKQFLINDGTLNKFVDCIDFCGDHTQFPSKRLKSSLGDMHWRMGYLDAEDQQTERGTKNEVMGLSIKDKPGKIRGKRAVRTYFEEFGCFEPGTKILMYDGSLKQVDDVKVGDIVMGPDNTPRNVLRTFSGSDTMYKIRLSNGDVHVVNSKHLIRFKKYDWYKKQYEYFLMTPEDVLRIKGLNKGYYIDKSDQIRFTHKDVLLDPYFLGLWLGDGDKYDSVIFNEDAEVIDWLYRYAQQNNFGFHKTLLKQSKQCYSIRLNNHFKRDGSVLSFLRHYDLIANKHIPLDYKVNSRDVMLNVIAGFIDTDGTLNQHKKYFEITQHERYKHLLDDLKFMCQSLGFKTSYTTKTTTTGTHYRLRISGHIERIPTKIKRKQYAPHFSLRNKRNWTEYTFTVTNNGNGEYYGFETDGDNLFLLSDFTIVHNCFPNFLDTYNTALYNAEEGGYSFGTLGVIGTGGTKDSDFSGALEMIYHPEGYHMYPLPNVFDKNTQGKGTCLLFIGAYMNRKGFYDEDGNSDVVGALLEVLMDRYHTKATTSDPTSVTQKKAELPLTIQDCIMRVDGNIYPVADIQARIAELTLDPHSFDDVYVGKLNIVGGKVEFQATSDTPIRDFPHKDNKREGAIEIFKMPEINKATGEVFGNRYLAGADVYDNDVAQSLSLGSIFILDAFTDKIVAEYTGRPMFADDFYEICRRLCLFYNARLNYEQNKKGLYSYFSRNHSTYLLTDTFSYLRDKDLVKGESFGNTAKGVTATVPIKNYSRGLIRDWLLKPIVKHEVVNGEEVETTYPQLMDIRNLALLKELSLYNLDGNFDRHDALAMLMLYREDVYRINAGEPSKRVETKNEFLSDSFFDTYDKMKRRFEKKKPVISEQGIFINY